jgi:hypothetical protein
MRRSLIAFILLALCASSDARGTLSPRAVSGGQDAGLPDDLGQLYATLDRADLGQYRELFAPASALAAIKQGKPLPAGTVLTLVVYSAKRDDAGRPVEDAKGRYVKDELVAFLVMRKQGADARKPPGAANAAWRFQLFRADKRIDRNANPGSCAACHAKRRDQDFVFTDDLMESFAHDSPTR